LLVFERDPQTIRCLEEILGGRWQIETAGTLNEALAVLDRSYPISAAILALDTENAHCAGLDLMRMIRWLHAKVPVLALASSHSSPRLANAFQVIGAEYAVKPVAPESVRAFAARVETSDPARVLGATVAEFASAFRFSERERAVLAIASEDVAVSREEMAGRFGVTGNTMKTVIRGLLRKCAQNGLSGVRDKVRREAAARVAGHPANRWQRPRSTPTR
jgi:DNA-binding response OmpR family regulator